MKTASYFCTGDVYRPKKGSTIEKDMTDYPKCIMGCCMLEQSRHAIEYIYLLRTCKNFLHQGNLDQANIMQSCDFNLMTTLAKKLTECCANKHFVDLKVAQECTPALNGIMKLVHDAAETFKHCANAGGRAVKQFCTLTEKKLFAVINQLNAAANRFFADHPGRLTTHAHSILAVSAHGSSIDDTRKGVGLFLSGEFKAKAFGMKQKKRAQHSCSECSECSHCSHCEKCSK
jgi:hypothetical protein